jgi:pseudouridine-5'-phosphate glycosidase
MLHRMKYDKDNDITTTDTEESIKLTDSMMLMSIAVEDGKLSIGIDGVELYSMAIEDRTALAITRD